MPLRIKTAGALQTITSLKVKQSGVIRSIKSLKVMDGGILRTVATFASPLSLSVSPSTPLGSANSASPVTVTTETVTATPTGGLAPFTYAWTFVSKSGGDTPTAFSPSFASTVFRQTNLAALASNTAVFRCTVTDSFGTTATADTNLTFINFGDEGVE